MACGLANALREEVLSRFAASGEVWITPPLSPSATLLQRVVSEMRCFAIEAVHARLWLMLPIPSIQRILSVAFGERDGDVVFGDSPLEEQTLLRVVNNMVARCRVVIGEIQQCRRVTLSVQEKIERLTALFIGEPCCGEMLLGVTPMQTEAEICPAFHQEQLLDLPMKLRILAGRLQLTMAELGRLESGRLLPMSQEGDARLIVGRRQLASGTCGISGGHLAFRVEQICESRER